jgi:hypothetical protein
MLLGKNGSKYSVTSADQKLNIGKLELWLRDDVNADVQ